MSTENSTHNSTNEGDNHHDNNWVKTTCAYCGVGCGVEAKVDTSGSIVIRGDKSHPANYGRLCSKGLALGETVTQEGRLLEPSINGETVNWEKALSHVSDSFQKTIQKYGKDSVAFYVSGQLLTEDYYVANKLMKGYIGSGNIDTNSRLCMSSSVAGHKRAFGSDTVPNCYEDFELTDMVVLVGSNLAWCHPVLYQRLRDAKKAKPSLKIIVIDPRETDSCELADLHLAIQPGTDVLLFNGLLAYLADNNYLSHNYIENHTQGFSKALMAAKEDTGESGVDLVKISTVTGVPIATLERFYRWFAENDKVLSVYSQGVNQSTAGTDKVNSIINCHLATGRIGKEGSGPFSITGQPNAMGGREVGGLANTLAAHMDFNDDDWQVVSDFWNTDQLTKKPGLKAVELFDAVASGKIKAVWIMATNPIVSMPDSEKIKRALEKCPLVVVSDCIADTDTTRCANVLLPAMGWAEKSGTVTNSERRISRQRQLITTDNNAKPDWWIMSQVALRMGYSGFNFTSASDIFREYAAMTGFRNSKLEHKRDLDISPLQHLSDNEYDHLPPQQWPMDTIDSADSTIRQKRFFAEGEFYTQTGRANIVSVNYRAPMTQVSQHFPIVLNSGRIRDQWHTMTRTGLVPHLRAHKPEPYIQINPQDALCFQLNEGNIAELNSQWGTAKARVVVSSEVNPGQIFMPIHWTQVDSSQGRICPTISPDVDPISGQPELKYTPVAIKRWHYSSEAIVISRTQLQNPQFDYWVKRKIAGGYLYYIAIEPSSELTSEFKDNSTIPQQLEELNGLSTSSSNHMSFNNSHTGHYRSASILNGELITAYIVAPKIQQSDYAWLDGLLSCELSTDIQRSILSGIAANSLLTGKQVCACKQVGEFTITDAIQEGCCSIESISAKTEAGTGCGSCIPEIKRLIDQQAGTTIAVAV